MNFVMRESCVATTWVERRRDEGWDEGWDDELRD